MAGRRVAEYGSWKSPIGGDVLAEGSTLLTDLTVSGGVPYWLQLMPKEGGRYALFSQAHAAVAKEVLPGYNVRTRVHEYGGAPYVVSGSDVFFSNFPDQLVYRKSASSKPAAVTKPGYRYADYAEDSRRNRLIAVREDHTTGSRLPVNTISWFSRTGRDEGVLLSGNDFYAAPRVDPSGERLAWITWNFPNMPWDGTELWAADLTPSGSVKNRRRVAGSKNESVVMPKWSPGGVLYFASDRSGFWNIYRWRDGKSERVVSGQMDMAAPHWVFGISSYDFLSEEEIVVAFTTNGVWKVGVADLKRHRLVQKKVTYTDIRRVVVSSGEVLFLGGSPFEPVSLVAMDPSSGSTEVLHRPMDVSIDGDYISEPRHIQFRTAEKKNAFALLYMPRNKDYKAPRGTKPPLLVVSHGGPTDQAQTYLSARLQAWTSRGFAVLDVNYGGSSGYGRKYRERLDGQWGIVDVDDCCNGASNLVRRGLVDRRRLVIRGGSAGGYTTLCALAFRRTFQAGASYFGVADVTALVRDTHKFESRYVDRLIAPYPEGERTYRERSALYHADRIEAPMIFFQGKEDAVVPPSQAESMVESLRRRGKPVAYIAFDGEQHGFRRAQALKRAFEAELSFYSRIFGFSLPENIEPVTIWNLN